MKCFFGGEGEGEFCCLLFLSLSLFLATQETAPLLLFFVEGASLVARAFTKASSKRIRGGSDDGKELSSEFRVTQPPLTPPKKKKKTHHALSAYLCCSSLASASAPSLARRASTSRSRALV